MHSQGLFVRKTTKDEYGIWSAEILSVGDGGSSQLISVVATDTIELLCFGTTRKPFPYLKASWIPFICDKKFDEIKPFSPYELVFEGRKLDANGKFTKRGRNWNFEREEPNLPDPNGKKYQAENYVEVLAIDNTLSRTSSDLLINGEWKSGKNMELMYRLVTQHCIATSLAVDHSLNCWKNRASVGIQVSRTDRQVVKFQFVMFDIKAPQWAKCVKKPFKTGDTVLISSENHTFLAKLLSMNTETKKGEFELFGLNAVERGGKIFENCPKLEMNFFKSSLFNGWFPHRIESIEPMFGLLCDSRMPSPTNKNQRKQVLLDLTIRPPTIDLKDGQLRAFQAICGESKFVLINAPPGTGKSTLVGRALLVLEKRRQRVLLLSDLNVAVDGLAQKCPEYVSTRVASMERRSQHSSFLESVRDGSYSPSANEKDAISSYQRAWRSVTEGKYNEDRAAKLRDAETEVLRLYYEKPVPIKLMTVALFLKTRIPQKPGTEANKYDVVMVDEASLLSTTNVLSIFWRVGRDARIVLIGDSKQLMPKNCSGAYNFSDLRNLTKVVEPIFLDCSFRSLPAIVNSWKFMYEDVNVKCFHQDTDSSLHIRLKLPSSSLIWQLDTESIEESGVNKKEIDHMSDFVSKLLGSELVNENDILLLCYYRAQANEIKKRMGNKKFRVHTVDEAQGSESRVVIIATTNCTATSHLQDPERATVAMSRAKELQICFVDKKVVKESPLWTDISHHTTSFSYNI